MTTDNLFLRFVLCILVVLGVSQCLAGCSDQPPPVGIHEPVGEAAAMVVAVQEPTPAVVSAPHEKPLHDDRASWCEPLDPPICTSGSDCPAGEECVVPWWVETGEIKVCSRSSPTAAERRWRLARLGVMVEQICKRGDGCDPVALLSYLRLLALRESTWRPWKRHRLNPDLAANESAWLKHRHKFAGNLAAANPDRFATGLGLYGQNPSLWLPRWDAKAPPEVLCGEVESTETHLRAARDQVRKIAGGVDCDRDGEPDYWGSACEEGGGTCRPSWYDASRTNSGSLCPGDADHWLRFVHRAADAGLDPWAPISGSNLGEPIPRATQDQVAAELRKRMDAVPR